jgi:ribonuclease D
VTGKVEYLDTDEAVAAFFSRTVKATQIAVDTEGASFHKFVDRIYLIQVSMAGHDAIVDPLPISPPVALGKMLEDPAVEVIFHDADYDLRLLHQDYGWHPRKVFDTRIAAQLLGKTAFGLAALLESYFGVKLDKKHQRADWSLRPLTPGMLAYAAQDTAHLIDLREKLAAELKEKHRWSWAEEEFKRLEGTKWDAEEPGSAFMRIKGARDLSRRELALLRELVTWRDGLAMKLDKSTFRVVGNEVLLEAARLAPGDRDTLGKIKGMPRGIVERHGAEVLGAIARGMTVPDGDLPKFPKSRRFARDPEFDTKVGQLKAVRDAAAKRLELDPGVLCSRDRMETVARALPRSVDELTGIEGLRRWQIAEMGEPFVEALRSFKPVAGPTVETDSPYSDEKAAS